jgi:RNA polymerase sigma factor (sigma-70 family)
MVCMETSAIATEAVPRERRLDFEEFFLEHHEPLFRALWLVTRNRHEAEEVMQDAFLRLLERWPAVQAAHDPGAYLYRTAMNVFRSRFRRAAVVVRKAIHQLPPDDEFAQVEARDAVVRALTPLPPRQRAALVLLDLVGLSSEEAGRALGIRAVTVRVLASRARTALREVLDEDR